MKIKLFMLFLLGIVLALLLMFNRKEISMELFKAELSSVNTVNIHPQVAFPSLQFEQPVDFQVVPDQNNQLAVVEQKGIVWVFPNDPKIAKADFFLDIRDRVFTGHMEEGLLGLAFHPDFAKNGYFFVYHSAKDPRRSIVARFHLRPNEKTVDPATQAIVMEILQPYGNHNGGQLAFGPDGYLYIGLGDGGSGGDPHGNGQNRGTLLGKILRIDVDRPSADRLYGIPSDNPFVGNQEAWREEIYAYGLRNPWRFSFDPVTGELWAGDVGQDKPLEEVDIIEKGKNYGWNIMEGTECFNPPQDCSRKGLELPIWQYSQDQGRSITGGYVYRGQRIPQLYGKYIYGDFVSGRIWALTLDERGQAKNEQIFHGPNLYISSFGVDQNQELYFCSFDGKIYTLKHE
ncbi:MAG: PQQ-dependent sugar dehydrogenase [Candidatus Omnitrophica bacterium]|nr:PQQ-dependent sugar dehydrogenase [Candidatus Omnitrophota bacterium]